MRMINIIIKRERTTWTIIYYVIFLKRACCQKKIEYISLYSRVGCFIVQRVLQVGLVDGE